jgi:tetratricopeptide (TPR) repeat protein
MPYSQDYIKRMLEQIGEFVVALKQMLVEDRLGEAREQLDLAYREALGLDPQFVRDAPEDYLILTAGMSRVGDVDKSLVLADLLSADGDWHARNGDYDVAQQCHIKAINVTLEIYLRQPFGTSREHIDRVEALIDKVEQYEVPYDTRWRLFRYHERMGQYADAEDDLYELLDAAPENEALIDEAAAFYQRLLGLKDHELLLGGLPRDEVQAGLEDVLAREANADADAEA